MREVEILKKKQLKCYLYTRVSTSMQVDGYSLDAQRDKLRKYGRSLRIPMKPLSTSRPLIWRRKSAAMYGVIQTAGAKRLPSQACSIVPIAAARCMSTAPTMASGFLNIPVPIIPKFRVGHYALHNTVSMRVLF